MTSASGGQRSIQLSYGRIMWVARGISRVLSAASALPHGSGVSGEGSFLWDTALLPASSSLPGTQMARATPRPLFGLAPSGVCHATSVTSGPVRSYRTLSPLPVRPARTRAAIGGLLSAALSVASRRPGVTRHPALWSSDFPPATLERAASDPYSHALHGHQIRPKGPDSTSPSGS